MKLDVPVALGSVAQAGSWASVALTIYFLVRALDLPVAVAPALLIIWAAVGLARRARSRDGALAPVESPTKQPTLTWGLLAILALLALAPSIRLAAVLATGDQPAAFLNADDAYNLMIAHGLAQAFPPPDLGYLGRQTTYHLGGPMLAEMLHRYALLPLHSALFGAVPLVMKAIALACVYRILGVLCPTLSTVHKLLGTFATGGVFLVDFYNLAWNARNLWVSGSMSLETIFGGMPIALALPGLVSDLPFYGSPLAICFFLVLLANMDRAHWLVLACVLFAIFLAKASVFVPIGLAWGCWATWRLVRFRDWRLFAAGIAGLALCLFSRRYVVEPNLGVLGLGPGWGIDALVTLGTQLARAAHVQGAIGTAAIGVVLLALGTQAFGWSAARLLREPEPAPPSRELARFLLLCGICAIALTTFFVFRIAPAVQEKFLAIHRQVQGQLWLGFDSYLTAMGKISISEAKVVLAYAFALLATGGIFRWFTEARTRGARVLPALCIAIALSIALWRAYQGAWTPLPAQTRTVTPATTEALARIPRAGSVIFTNDCAYDRKVQLHLPLMNAGITALYGHQFWACDFMFGANYAARDAADRLDRWQWFWATPPQPAHRVFLQQQGITHLLVRRDVPGGEAAGVMLARAEWASLVHQNAQYSVYSVKP